MFVGDGEVGADEVVDLLAPNLNKEKMLYKAQMERDAQKSTAQMKKERDKAALDKQRSASSALRIRLS
jgi:hypothetical protein